MVFPIHRVCQHSILTVPSSVKQNHRHITRVGFKPRTFATPEQMYHKPISVSYKQFGQKVKPCNNSIKSSVKTKSQAYYSGGIRTLDLCHAEQCLTTEFSMVYLHGLTKQFQFSNKRLRQNNSIKGLIPQR